MKFFTFMVDIGRHSKNDLERSLNIMIKSMENNILSFNVTVFTNFEPTISHNCVEYRNYYDKSKYKTYDDKWLNLSFNKINVFKDLYDKYGESFTWIDLDTYITSDISYMEDLDHYLLSWGGTNRQQCTIFSNNNEITIPLHKTIQGDFWKLSIELYHNLMGVYEDVKKKGLIPKYDIQSLCSYYVHILNNNVNVIGYNYKTDTMNGLSVWSRDGNTHATKEGLNNLYRDESGTLRTKLHDDREIHILSFTFFTLKKLWNLPTFKNILSM